MHVAYVSAETAERRRNKVEDVRKRSEYRKAHGMDKDETTFGGWTAKTDREILGSGMREGGDGVTVPSPGMIPDLQSPAVDGSERPSEQAGFVDFEGKMQPVRKKWFGIW